MFNPNFNNQRNFTFQHATSNLVPPPPVPPPFFIPPHPYRYETTDQDYVKSYETKIPPLKPKPKSKYGITHLRELLHNMIVNLNELKDNEKILSKNKDKLSDIEWKQALEEVDGVKKCINDLLVQVSNVLETFRKAVAIRSAKRLRLKRLRVEQQREKQEKIKELQERSRKIDENLQKIQDDINKAKQEEAAKLQADIILKEVLRKKHDAKKCVAKLEALVKLRKARGNTARGRGEAVSERDSTTFNNNIEKLKSLWIKKQALYEKEESDLRSKLSQDEKQGADERNNTDLLAIENLAKWRNAMFGGMSPQVDFQGDLNKFVGVRMQWDSFIHSDGSPLPIGWVLPSVVSE